MRKDVPSPPYIQNTNACNSVFFYLYVQVIVVSSYPYDRQAAVIGTYTYASFGTADWTFSKIKFRLKNCILWDITPSSPFKVNKHFLLPASFWFITPLISRLRRRKRHVPPKRRLAFNGLHHMIPQKIKLFITTAVRTSTPMITHVCWIWGSQSVLSSEMLR
jgi:hypothetical protein